MSIINDALNKTQDKLTGGKKTPANPQTKQSVVQRAQQKNTSKVQAKQPTYSININKPSPKKRTVKSIVLPKLNRTVWQVLLAAGILIILSASLWLARMEHNKFVANSLPYMHAPMGHDREILASLHLDGTMVMGRNKAAIINGRMYHIGDRLQGMQVAKISSDRVIFQVRNNLYELR